MQKERLANLLQDIAEGDELAQEELLAYIMQQPKGIQKLALEALKDGAEDTYEQLMLTLADDPDLVRLTAREREPLDKERLSQVHIIGQMSEREWWQSIQGESAEVALAQEVTTLPAPQALLDRLERGERKSRIQAAHELADYHDQTTIEALITALCSGERFLTAAAVEALQQIGTPTIPALIAAMQEADEQARWYMVKALSTTANEQAVPALLTALQDKHSGIRWLAAEGLAYAGGVTLVPLLRRLADDKPSAWVRHGAWHILRKIELPHDEERRHYKQLAKELKRSSPATIPHLARKELRRLGEDA
jgi:hypothetical protein